MPATGTRPSRERGQALPLLLIVLVVAAAAAAAVGAIGVAAAEAGRAQTAADAAALAGAAAGPAAATAVAAANDAELIAYDVRAATVAVEVRYRRATARASAAAEAAPAPARGGDRAGLAPAMVAALARADDLLGQPVPVMSGHRSRAEQEALWEQRADNPYPVARPGTSLHEAGLAVDVPADFVATLLAVADRAGLCQPLPVSDPVHFEACPPSPP